MKRIAAALLIVMLVAFLSGCGGGSEEGEQSQTSDTISLLTASTQAMSELEGYRMTGTINIGSGTDGAGGQGQPVSMDIRADVQNSGGEMRQHMFATIGEYEVEAYIVGGVYYQNIPGQGWQKSSVAANQIQGMNIGLVDAEQMEMMAEMAEDAKVIDEDEETEVLSLLLDQDYFQASMEIYRDYMEEAEEQLPEEWLEMVESISAFQAELRIWVRKADDLFQRMEMNYEMSGLEGLGTITSSMEMDFFDYGEDILVELPEEAAQAPEVELTQ